MHGPRCSADSQLNEFRFERENYSIASSRVSSLITRDRAVKFVAIIIWGETMNMKGCLAQLHGAQLVLSDGADGKGRATILTGGCRTCQSRMDGSQWIERGIDICINLFNVFH